MTTARLTFRVSFPSDLKPGDAQAWLHALNGVMRSGWFGAPALVFELWATDQGLTHRLRLPAIYADYAVGQLRTLVPGSRVEPDDREPLHGWDVAVELASSSPSRSLRIGAVETLNASLLGSVQTLRRGDAVLLQLVAMPARAERLPREKPVRTGIRTIDTLVRVAAPGTDEITDRRAKLAEPNFLAVLRVAGRASTPARASHLIRGVLNALGSTRSPYNGLRRRLVPQGVAKRRTASATTPVAFPMQLSATELSALAAWPCGNPHVAGLPHGYSRHLPATGIVARSGRIVADSNFPGAERPLAIRVEDSFKHLHVIGGTGVGKTTLLANLAAQDFAAGHGVVLVEAKGDLYSAALDLVPEDRLDDVVVLDVTDRELPVGFNILADGNPRAAVERICGLFERLYHDTRGVWTRELLYHGLSTLTADPKYTFIDLAPLLYPMSDDEKAWRDELIASVTDKELMNFWTRFTDQPEAARQRMAQPVMDRIWQLNARPEIRNIIGQSQSSLDMRQIIREGKILLVNLAGMPESAASLAGTLVINSLWSAVQAGASNGGLKQPVFLYLDEFQSFLNLPIAPEEMLAKARSFGLGMVLAHQHLGQLPMELRSAVMANARSKVCFQLSADDAMSFTREFGRSVDREDFMNLGAYEVICRLAAGANVSQPVTGITRPPTTPIGLATTVKSRSRNRYGRPVHLVESEIEDRRRPAIEATNIRRPKLGPVEWK